MPKTDTPKDAELEQTLAYIISFIDKIDAKEKVEIAPAETDKPMIVTSLYGKTLPDGLDGAREAFVELGREHLARQFWARRRWFVWLAREWRNMPEERRDSKSMLALMGRIPRPVMEWLIIIAGISASAAIGISRFEDGFEKCFGERPDIHEYKKVARALGFDAETAQWGDFTLADIVEHLDGMLLARKAADGAGQRDGKDNQQDKYWTYDYCPSCGQDGIEWITREVFAQRAGIKKSQTVKNRVVKRKYWTRANKNIPWCATCKERTPEGDGAEARRQRLYEPTDAHKKELSEWCDDAVKEQAYDAPDFDESEIDEIRQRCHRGILERCQEERGELTKNQVREAVESVIIEYRKDRKRDKSRRLDIDPNQFEAE